MNLELLEKLIDLAKEKEIKIDGNSFVNLVNLVKENKKLDNFMEMATSGLLNKVYDTNKKESEG